MGSSLKGSALKAPDLYGPIDLLHQSLINLLSRDLIDFLRRQKYLRSADFVQICNTLHHYTLK